MSAEIPDWVGPVVDDLRSVSSDLLEPGLAKPAALGGVGGHGPILRGLLNAADAFVALTPRLLSELEASAEGTSGDWRGVKTPRQARPSLAPQDYALREDVALPIRWLRFETELRPDLSALRWALHISGRLIRDLGTHSVRLAGQLEDALLTRAGESEWALQDARQLRSLASSLQQRVVAVRGVEADIKASAGGRIVGTDRVPAPYPQQPSWLRLRRLARSVLEPEAMLGTVLNDLLSEPIAIADVPFLYQRWCGLHLVRALERLGWMRQGDLVGPLFLGGHIEFSGPGEGRVTVWVEPRISKATMPLTGWGCSNPRHELTPDFLITCGPAGARDAFVLDATLSIADDVLRAKSKKYRNDPGIIGQDALLVAGVPVVRRPLRAWAIAPLGGARCHLGDAEGKSGGIPLNPRQADTRALDAWVADVAVHACRHMRGAGDEDTRRLEAA